MDDAARVSGADRLTGGKQDAEQLASAGQAGDIIALISHMVGQSPAFHLLHHIARIALGVLADAVDRKISRMIDRGHDRGLLLESGGQIRVVRMPGKQGFYGEVLPEIRGEPLRHLSHAALAKLASEDDVTMDVD